MAYEEFECPDCVYYDSDDNAYPCNKCYNGVVGATVEKNPLLFKPIHPCVKDNPVTHPSHYTQGGIECIDAMEAAYGKKAVEVFCLLNAFKYLWRTEHKNGKEDLEKAMWYLKKRLELMERE